MTDLLRQEVIATAQRVVIKVGTRVLTRDGGGLDHERIAQIAHGICDLVEQGRQVILVSSGAVGAGMGVLGEATRPTDLAQLQAVAAVGQARLIDAYGRVFEVHRRHSAQVLLTASDLDHRHRYLNVRNTLVSLLDMGVIPIVNENDTVAVDELEVSFGDNDRLAALVTNLIAAPLLVMLSDVEGLYDGEPSRADSRVVPVVAELTDEHQGWVRDRRTGMGRGGMASKIEAARMVTAAGESAIVASGRTPGILTSLFAGEPVGTLFLAQGKTVSPRKRWLGFSARPKGKLILDDGASRAITRNGRSLLAIGVTGVEGEFGKGDIISLVDRAGHEIARGLTNYTVDDIRRIRGLRSDDIKSVLGHVPYEEVIHRDNLLVLMAPSRD